MSACPFLTLGQVEPYARVNEQPQHTEEPYGPFWVGMPGYESG